MSKATYRQMMNFFDRLSVVLQAGIDIRKAIADQRDSSHGAQRVVMAKIHQEIHDGATFAGAMRNRKTYFPAMVVAMIDAGEQGGRLSAASKRISDYYKTLIEVRTQFLTSIAWPVFQLVMSIIIIGVLILILGMIAGSGGNRVDPFGFGLTTTQYFVFYLAFVVTGAVSIVGIYISLSTGILGSIPLDLARKIPILGRTIEMLTLSRSCWTMATAIEAGVVATETLKLALESTQQWYYTRFVSEVVGGIRDGGNFGSVLRRINILPEDFLQAVEVGEATGKIPESMQQLATIYDHDSRRNLKVLGTVASTVVMLSIFVTIGMVIIQMYRSIYLKPMNDLLESI